MQARSAPSFPASRRGLGCGAEPHIKLLLTALLLVLTMVPAPLAGRGQAILFA